MKDLMLYVGACVAVFLLVSWLGNVFPSFGEFAQRNKLWMVGMPLGIYLMGKFSK